MHNTVGCFFDSLAQRKEATHYEIMETNPDAIRTRMEHGSGSVTHQRIAPANVDMFTYISSLSSFDVASDALRNPYHYFLALIFLVTFYCFLWVFTVLAYDTVVLQRNPPSWQCKILEILETTLGENTIRTFMLLNPPFSFLLRTFAIFAVWALPNWIAELDGDRVRGLDLVYEAYATWEQPEESDLHWDDLDDEDHED